LDGTERACSSEYFAGIVLNELSECHSRFGRRAAALRHQRKSLKSSDAIILASAQVSGRILVTRNTKDFPAEMPGIRVPYKAPKETK